MLIQLVISNKNRNQDYAKKFFFFFFFFFFVIFYFSSDTEIHDTETRIETKKYTIDTHIYRFNIRHA